MPGNDRQGAALARRLDDGTGNDTGERRSVSIARLRPWPAAIWRGYLAGRTDADLALELREWAEWSRVQASILPTWLRDDPAGDAVVARWDGGVVLVARAMTDPIRDELRRRVARRSAGPNHVTTDKLLRLYSDRLAPVGDARWRCLCPWHDDSRPSLYVYDRGWAHCFACGAHRPVADLAAAWQAVAA